MSDRPSLWDSLADHWRLARELRHLQIEFSPEKCTGVWQCYDVCPVGCWSMDRKQRVAIFHDAERCIACGACVLQCPQDAIKLTMPNRQIPI